MLLFISGDQHLALVTKYSFLIHLHYHQDCDIKLKVYLNASLEINLTYQHHRGGIIFLTDRPNMESNPSFYPAALEREHTNLDDSQFLTSVATNVRESKPEKKTLSVYFIYIVYI